MNPVVIIPTFVSMRRSRSAGSVVAVYDHATSLNQQGELARCLNSLINVRGMGQIVVLVASEPGIEDQALTKVRRITSKFPSLPIAVMGAPELELVQQRFEQLGLGRLSREVGLTGYSAIRNFGLVISNIFGFDAAVFLDDDAVVEDEFFLQKAVYGLGKLTRKGIPILAKTGYYFNAKGTYYSQSQNRWYNRFWQQGKSFNEWIERAMRGPRLSRSNHVCGGCMALHKEAFRRVSFDPWIPRGEDLDYMLNLRMYGSDIWFDNKWHMRHLPPEGASEGDRFRQDIYRWMYENRKMEFGRTQIDLLQVKPASLEPYPGPFLESGIDGRVRVTALLRSLGRPDHAAYRRAAKAVHGEALAYAQRNCAKYFEFQYVWPELMTRVENDPVLREALVQSVSMRPAAGNSVSARTQGVSVPASDAAGVDPGATSEIRLNLGEAE
ncbi:hypothetical protein JI75_00985 [Berryella intestinalis]|uniref:Glycosyltransferase n=1 Tax=Berryella intestinalis TaxID=1531429 RepID=A0A0A8B3R8_9ACTN|nr:hypothetical protein [Berryella intestinalis]AJC11478.1 hypothetical protein JI75_00985 [Berryella intestinalis]